MRILNPGFGIKELGGQGPMRMSEGSTVKEPRAKAIQVRVDQVEQRFSRA